MYGPDILVRTLSSPTRRDKSGNLWQYHSRSDHHSKVACWGVIFDLVLTTPLLRRHIDAGVVCFGINHEMRDFVHAMLEGRQPECDLELAIDITLAIYAGYVSADRKGAEVEVPRI